MSDPVLTFDTDNSCDSQAEFIAYRDGSISITLDHPWAGDSETGFGQCLTSTLTLIQVFHLKHWLALWGGNREIMTKRDTLIDAAMAAVFEYRKFMKYAGNRLAVEVAINELETAAMAWKPKKVNQKPNQS